MRRVFVSLIASLLVVFGVSAQAQEVQHFALDRFSPASASDRFFGVAGADAGGEAQLSAMLLGEYAYRPLVLYANDGSSQIGSIVSDQLVVHAALSLSLLDRLLLSVNVPVSVLTDGDSPTASGLNISSPSGAAIGDVRLGARLRLLGAPRSVVVLSLAGAVWVPTGDADRFAGDGSVRGEPSLVLSGEGRRLAYAINAGLTLRRGRQLLDSKVGNELTFGGALGYLLADRQLQIGPEVYGTTMAEDAFERSATNAEAILGARYRITDWVLGAGAGPGLTRGLGTPTLRALASVAYAPQPAKVAAPPKDSDGDGILDGVDACPQTPGKAAKDAQDNGCPDRDADGIFDKRDACIDVPGVANSDPKKNGCPSDRDADGILDSEDACPDVPGEQNSDPKKNGCPPDRDADGILDAQDACVDIPGVKNADPRENGCPADTDGDGFRDDQDACPREKGKADADPKKHGCPSLVRVTETEIVILQQVQFKTGSDVILAASDELLQQVADVLVEHSEILRMEVQGHTDNRGKPAYNQKLSERRASSVVKWLTTHGIDAARFDAHGYGMDQPVADNSTEEGRQLNRRVQFKIVTIKRRSESQE